MEPVAGCLGLPLLGLRLCFGFFGATLAAGLAARAFEVEEATSCDGCAKLRAMDGLIWCDASIWRSAKDQQPGSQ